jgi:hypothetical protein
LLFGFLALVLAGMLVFGLKTGFMPTYLTGGAKKQEEPILYWMAAVVLAIALAGSLWAAVASI